jgi:hypothetical protein
MSTLNRKFFISNYRKIHISIKKRCSEYYEKPYPKFWLNQAP